MNTNPDSALLAKLAELMVEQNIELKKQTRELTQIRTQSVEQTNMLHVLGRIAMRETLIEVDRIIQSRQMTMMETVAAVAEGKSLGRWGDGEIKIMLQPEFDVTFQKYTPTLADDLRKLLLTYDDSSSSFLQAMPTVYTTRLWMGIWAETWHELKPLLESSKAQWGNTHVSRPIFFQRHGLAAVAAWRSVWQDKDVCIITGRGSRFDPIPELFDNVASIERIDSEPTDAYFTLEALKDRIGKRSDNNQVYLIALGPTGTVLAGHLASEAGGARHAIDIGHLVSSYRNVFKNGAQPEQLPVSV
ncbi:DUF1792 domain-containing protein [Arthrobacter yangruifuii]|uniref:DUF1792 domain-containing protein n=1 Tax=Arthrobacter yangruifuii TaxID=2606616 RepID=A0A5N6MRM8_9MICC|nr:GT-D fold domain-containing glycosyltransferase [Arthrobacter yangruifuii]KAD4007151.1 DUF1792 domain-containing protein [Arthrobacter yangruifuii]